MNPKADEETAATYYFNSVADFSAYSKAYAAGYRNPKDILIFATTDSTTSLSDTDYISLGTSTRPFAGTIDPISIGTLNFELANCPLFNYVTTDMTITGNKTINLTRVLEPETPSENSVLKGGALFANHVVPGESPANWTIESKTPDSLLTTSEPASNNKGLIGTIAPGCNVTINFTNNTDMNVESDTDAGLICGNVGAGSTLNVTVSGTASTISVTTSAGNAGGLVGKLSAGSTLNIMCSNTTGVNAVTTEGSDGFAGGIVGYVDGANVNLDNSVASYAVTGKITGANGGAGGLFGYYKNASTSPNTFTLDKFTPQGTITVASNGYSGGIFGVLENTLPAYTFDGSKSSSKTISVDINSGSSRGGVCGGYRTANLSDTFNLTNTSVSIYTGSSTNSGGLIGKIDGSSAAYVSISEISSHSRSNGPKAGLIGSFGDKGSFVDVTGNIVVSGGFKTGIAENIPSGVLRLSGVTDISGISLDHTSNLVINRDRGLVYALGDGEGGAGENGKTWTLLRNTNTKKDDILPWGQVVRTNNSDFKESDLFTVNMPTHTVTLKQAVTNMSTKVDFAKTALNIKLATSANIGALCFMAPSSSSTLLSGNLSLTADIDLAGTGIMGLTRDNGANDPFSGTFDGKNHKIVFAIGEKYGLNGAGGALDSSTAQGAIFTHKYVGLFAKTSDATIKDLLIDGTANIYPTETGYQFGGVVAYAVNGLTLDNVDSKQEIILRMGANNLNAYVGGFIGQAGGSNLNINVTDAGDGSDPTLLPTILDYTPSGINGGATNMTYMGGVIGFVSNATSQNISIKDSVIGFKECTRTNFAGESKNTTRPSAFGGVIAGVNTTSDAYTKGNCEIEIDNCRVVLDASGICKSNKFGGVLGMDWYSADVTVKDLVVDADITAAGDITDFGGLVQTATGHWDVQSIEVENCDYNVPPASGSTFGFVVNKTTRSTNTGGLYLVVNNTSDNYDIGNLNVSGTTFAVFDEICRSSIVRSDNKIDDNGNSIISITTSDDGLIEPEAEAEVYLNKTAYGKTHTINGKTRYYYNVEYARNHASTPKYKFYLWSLWTYANTSLSAWFPSEENPTFTGDLDMVGISYYPVNLRRNVTFNNATLKFDNNAMEAMVINDAETAAPKLRTTRCNSSLTYTTQHNLMHTGAFLNNSGHSITVSGSNGLVIKGNVPWLSDNHCGFLVTRTLSGTENARASFTASKLVFDGDDNDEYGAHITTNTGANLTSSSYAPLLVNKIGYKTTLEINAAEQSTTKYNGFTGKYAASSLIGDVGNDTAKSIYMTFSNLVFDARKTHVESGLDTPYGTETSIFSRATILNKFQYLSDCSGVYNYEVEEDWPSASSPSHNVTYGWEVTESVEHREEDPNDPNQTVSKERHYYFSEYYTRPDLYTNTDDTYSFSGANWLPYVYTGYNAVNKTHELLVNIFVSGNIEGCGKYDDPFIITEGSNLEHISEIISTGTLSGTIALELPDDLAAETNYNKYAEALTPSSYKKSYTYNAQSNPNFFVCDSNSNTKIEIAKVRKYLAGAYYYVKEGITLSNNYTSLGSPITESPEYAFRGVLIGPVGGVTITNNSMKPLIKTSMGCVVKNITVTVNVRNDDGSNIIQLIAPQATSTSEYLFKDGNDAYGAVIGQILGGDTIIDNVDVSFQNTAFKLTQGSNTYSRLIPIGGYVGVVVNGGLIFRNMNSGNVGLATGQFTVETTTTSVSADLVSDSSFLYVNPIIGRVIAGYAFNETNEYHPTEETMTLKNGVKNYSISDLNPSDAKLKITYKNSTFEIQIPNGQAMYVLGAIVNSGAASATVNTGTQNAYDGFTKFWQAYRAHTTTRGGSSYATVGSSTGTDFTAAGDDKYSDDANKVPYIVRTYTSSFNGNNEDTGKYYARSLSTKDNVTIYVTGSCNVAAGFRGIGSIYYNKNSLLRLRVLKMQGMNGNDVYSQPITLNMRFLEYDQATVKVYEADNDCAGFGLFNFLEMKDAKNSNSISDLTLKGSVYYDILKVSDGSQSAYSFKNDGEDSIRYENVLNVGGLIGQNVKTKKIYLKNITLDGISIEGARYSGGLVGFVTDSQKGNTDNLCIIDNCGTGTSTTGVTVKSGVAAGGLVGYVLGQVKVNGDSTNKTPLLIKEISVKCTDADNGFGVDEKGTNTGSDGSSFDSITWLRAKWVFAAGGVVGLLQPLKTYSCVNYYKIEGVEGTENHIYCAANGSGDYTYAGGVCGLIKNKELILENIDINNVNISAAGAGGVLGAGFSDKGNADKLSVTLAEVKLDGNTDGGNAKSHIHGSSGAGGFFGVMYKANDNGKGEFIVNDSLISGYEIVSDYEHSKLKSGGAAGVLGFSDPGKNYSPAFDLTVQNLLIEDSVIYNHVTSSYTSNGTGSLAGLLNKSLVKGYNILVKDTEIKTDHQDKRTTASVIGNNKDDNNIVKITGVSVNLTGDTAADTIKLNVGRNTTNNFTEHYGNGGYIIFTDFDGESNPGAFPAGIGTQTHVDAKLPYVTVNPSGSIGGVTLTGDGIATSASELTIRDIVNDSSERYRYSRTGNLTAFNKYSDKFISFISEVSYPGNDFPVLLVDSLDRGETTEMINSYIRLLTNTTYDYTENVAGVYNVSLYKMSYDTSQGKFVADSTVANVSLKRNNRKFYMLYNLLDSGSDKMQFTLIDVEFLNPSNSSEVAYHLYIPVFVKKVLSYRFEISARSGTDYLKSLYNPGELLMENIGTPATMYFKYIYSRTPSEWADAINNGESVERNYNKTITLTKANNTSVLKYFPADTLLVLVDPSDGRAYYSTIGIAMGYPGSGDIETEDLKNIDLSRFKSVMTVSGSNYQFSGDSFSPRKFSEMLNITVAAAPTGEGTLVKTSGSETATVFYNGEGYRPADDLELADNSVQKYTVTVTGSENDRLEEDYYLTFFTEGGAAYELFHSFIASTPYSFSDQNYPSKIEAITGSTQVHYITGKIFEHDGLSLHTISETGSEVMSDANRFLNVQMSVMLGLSDDLDTIKRDIQNLLQQVDVYQSFLVYLNRTEGMDISRAILGNPDLSTSRFRIARYGEEATGAYTYYSGSSIDLTQNRAEFISPELSDYFNDYEKFVVYADVKLTYPNEGIAAQFPGRNEMYPDNGVTVSCASNIGFSGTEIEYSKNSITKEEQGATLFYSQVDLDYAILFLNPVGDRVGDYTPLGINALNLSGESQVSSDFDLMAVLDVSSVIDEIEDYTTADVMVYLSQKQNDGKYGSALDIDDYVLSLKYINDDSSEVNAVSTEPTSYLTSFNRADLDFNGAEIVIPTMRFTVETGDPFEAKGHTYGNYRIDVVVALRDSHGTVIKVTRATNYVIYTNAKIVPDFIILGES
ncbi:MAG: hypothetical protein K6B54_01455 [Clostridia bacterium]|nr:hypothetical protein [Clostridia bacterium]